MSGRSPPRKLGPALSAIAVALRTGSVGATKPYYGAHSNIGEVLLPRRQVVQVHSLAPVKEQETAIQMEWRLCGGTSIVFDTDTFHTPNTKNQS